MSDKIKTGRKGEDLAAEFLEDHGYEIVERNFRFRKSEIDLIVKKKDWLLFVEVKTRTSSGYGEPEDFVTIAQANKIYEAAEEYIFSRDWQGNIRFDVISIKLGIENEVIHFEDAIN
jgi:putative endonuclease